MIQVALKDASNTGIKVKKERTNMVNARKAQYLSQVQVAERTGVKECTVVGWEKAYQKPRLYQMEKLRDILGFTGSDDDLLRIFTIVEEPATKDTIDMELSRRQTLQSLGIVFIPGTAQLAIPVVGPNQVLPQCEAAIASCWSLIKHGDYDTVERLLNANIPTLEQYVNAPAYQQEVAGLLTQGRILQISFATARMQFAEREKYCEDAVRFGELSNDRLLLALAQYWQADTYTYCFEEPQTAIRLLNNTLKTIGNESPLMRSRVFGGLSIAYAQDKDEWNAAENERKSLKYAEMAYSTIPSHPELAPFSEKTRFGLAELDQSVGKAHLYLAMRSSSKDYALQAYKAFEQSISGKATSKGYLAQALFRKADAASALGNMDECVKCVEQGVALVSSVQKLTLARDVLRQVPTGWKKETKVQDLHKHISNAIVVARR